MWICTWVSNDELQGDILTGRLAAQFLDLPVAGGSSLAAQYNHMKMVNGRQSGSFLQLAGRGGVFHQDSA